MVPFHIAVVVMGGDFQAGIADRIERQDGIIEIIKSGLYLLIRSIVRL